MSQGTRGPKGPPPTASAREIELFRRLGDPAHMLEVLQRELGRATEEPIRVTRVKTKLRRTRAADQAGRLEVVYRVLVERRGQGEREYVLLGTAPETAEFLRVEEGRCRALRGHPAVAPFREVAVHVGELELALRLFPLDPALPALAELTGSGGAALLSPYMSECRAGATVERVEWELRHYKPFKRAVLRITASFSGPNAPPRPLYAKLFHDDRGSKFHAELAALSSAARGARSLRVPESLGYDAERRMFLMSEAAGPGHLIEWIKCLEKHRPLPAGVDLARVERCVVVAAESLAELQRSGIRPSRARTFRSALAALERDLDALRAKLPRNELVRSAEELLARLEALAPSEEELLPAHGGFRHKQTVGDEGSLTVIDWDGLCRGDSALDPATFLARLRQEPVRDPGNAPEMARLAETFRREFLARRPAVSPGRLALYEAVVLTERLLRSFRRATRDGEMPRRIRNLAAAAREMLDLAGARPVEDPPGSKAVA
jgi:hypothetical protein